MARTPLVISCLLVLHFQIILAQSPVQYGLLALPLPEMIEAANNCVCQPVPVLTESPCNVQLPLPLPPSSTTIITDCSPTACKNLANTLQLMIVCNLLQNTKDGSDLALQLASPIINELFTSPILSCGCANPFATGVVSPTVASPTAVPSTVISPNVIDSSNVISGLTNAISSISPLLLSSGLLQGLIEIK
ncbi:uncharacterized protein LOC113515463 [Galleria mellonella]|uniref:Uncharacterized protein LOC113515463 n=1 Tax=Galleria mellonella TaxID=7137 RepID=A0A6J1WKZ3_GALME|nr:uncharacterized protein LOC113515463 [Galleria mellonella]